jgi:hypothetical protein
MTSVVRATMALLVSEGAALQRRVDALGGCLPERPVCLEERLDFALRQFESLIPQSDQRFERLPHEPRPQLFVREQLADEPLNGSLGHCN